MPCRHSDAFDADSHNDGAQVMRRSLPDWFYQHLSAPCRCPADADAAEITLYVKGNIIHRSENKIEKSCTYESSAAFLNGGEDGIRTHVPVKAN